jgi:hypothetical protein
MDGLASRRSYFRIGHPRLEYLRVYQVRKQLDNKSGGRLRDVRRHPYYPPR